MSEATGGPSRQQVFRDPRHRRILWVTNLPAPYRLLVWDALISEGIELEVWILATNEINRTWGRGTLRAYVKRIRAARLRVNGREFYLSAMPSLRLLRRLKDFDGVVIGGWDQILYWRVAVLSFLLGRPRVLFYESTSKTHQYNSGPLAWARRVFLRQGAEVILVPGEMASEAVAAHGVASSRIVTTFNSIDQPGVLKAVRDLGERRIEGPLRFCYAGQLIERKNIAALLQAFSALDVTAPTELHIVGQGPLRGCLEEFAYGLLSSDGNKSVFWHGGLDPDAAIRQIAGSHILVLPSTTEVWGLVVNEALAAGLHVVVSTNCGVAASVERMRGVYLCGTSPSEVQEGMWRAARDWSGYISDPEILTVGSPHRFAQDVVSAIHRATGDAVS